MNYKNAWEEYKAKNGVTPIDLLNKDNYIETIESKKRMDICLECDHLIKLTKQCKECGCFMNLKTKLDNAKCPLGKW
jgi:hypothetical protein